MVCKVTTGQMITWWVYFQCLTEVVVILDLVCQLDTGQIPRVHQEIRRLYTRLSQDAAHSPTVLRILQFFLNHSEHFRELIPTGEKSVINTEHWENLLKKLTTAMKRNSCSLCVRLREDG